MSRRLLPRASSTALNVEVSRRLLPRALRIINALVVALEQRGYREDGTPFTEAAMRAATDRAARVAGLRRKGPHTLRHTVCSHLAMKGVPVRAIQELAGHQSITTTMRYMHLSPSALDGAIQMLERDVAGRGDILETNAQPA